MAILVVGSVGIDSIETPFGAVERVQGGAASYFSLAAALYDAVNLVAVVGSDFPAAFRANLQARHVDLAGLQVMQGETFRWGVWGSLSRANFEKLLEMDEDPKRTELPAMFSWLSNRVPEYPDTLNLKMYAHIQPVGIRPTFFLEPSDHPLAQEYHHGISAERVKELMLRQVKELKG